MSSTENQHPLLLTVLNAIASRAGGQEILKKIMSDASLIDAATVAEIEKYISTERPTELIDLNVGPTYAKVVSSIPARPALRATPGFDAARKASTERASVIVGGTRLSEYPLIFAYSNNMSKIVALISNAFRLISSTPIAAAAASTGNVSPSLMDGKVMEKGGKLVFIKEDGSEEAILLDDNDYLTSRLSNPTCKSVGLNNKAGQPTCMNYLLNCLHGKDIQQCKNYLKQANFYNNMASEVYMLDINTLKRFLEALQFTQPKTTDPVTGKAIYEFESYDSWANKLKTVLNADDVKAILGNEELVRYIKAVKHRLDNHPNLLNPGLVGVRNNVPAYKTQTATNYGLASKNDVPNSVRDYERTFNVVNQHMAMTRAHLGLAMPAMGISALPIGMMIGGASRFDEIVSRRPSKILRNLYNSVSSGLSAKNTTLSKADKDRIEELFNVLMRTEETLTQAIRILDLYSSFLDVLPSGVANGAGLSLSQMENEVRAKAGARLDKAEKRTGVLVDCLRTICNEL